MVHVVKIYFNSNKDQQIRRLAVTSEVVSSFPLLQEKVRTLFQLPSNSFNMKWKDSENDFILMTSDEELAHALANSEDAVLRLYVETQQQQTAEAKEAPKPKKNGAKHPMVVCDGCDMNIFGDRFKCLQCKNFDLCSVCNQMDKHPDHDMIKLVTPSHIPREWVFMGARKMWKSMFSTCPRMYFRAAQAENNEKKTPSPTLDMKSALENALKGDFAEAHKVFNEAHKAFAEGLTCFLKQIPETGGVDIEATCKVRKPETAEKASEAQANNESKESGTSTGKDVEQEVKAPAGNENLIDTKCEESSDNETKCKEVSEAVKVDKEAPPAFTIFASAPAEVGGLFPIPKVEIPAPTNNPECCTVDGFIFLTSDGEFSDAQGGAAGTATQKEEVGTQEVAAEPVVGSQPMYPVIEDNVSDDRITTTDPLIIEAISMMQAMGFTNEGGWLEKLLINKQGNINAALDSLYPHVRN